MTDIERARDYIRIFIAVGDRWEDFAPVDGERTPDGLRLGSVEIGPDRERDGVWFLKDGETVKRYAMAVSS